MNSMNLWVEAIFKRILRAGLACLVMMPGLLTISGCSQGLPEATALQQGAATQRVQSSATPFVFPPTFTPVPAESDTNTPTPRPSRTPLPTATSAPTIQPSPTPLFDIRQATINDQPIITSSLLYFDNGEVRLWDNVTNENRPLDEETLPSDLQGFATSDGGVLIGVASKVDAEVETYIYNRFSEEIISSTSIEADSLVDLSLSPDGSFLVISLVEGSETMEGAGEIGVLETPEVTSTETTVGPTPVPSPTATPAAGDDGTDPEHMIYFWDTQGEPELIGRCNGICTSFLWEPLNRFVVWGDDDGLWRLVTSETSISDPEIVLEPFLVAVSASGEKTGSYLPLSISSSGRYVVVRKGIRTGSVLAVVDLEEQIIESLPGTGEYSGGQTGFTWLFGDLLTIARPGVARLEILPAVEVWRVSEEIDGSMFDLFGRYLVSEDYNVITDAPYQLQDGRVGFLVNNFRNPADSSANGVYILDITTGLFEQVNYLPIVQVEQIAWSLDGAGVLIQSASRTLYVPNGYGQIYSVGGLLGRNSCCHQWLP
jgi:hypothetical protein